LVNAFSGLGITESIQHDLAKERTKNIDIPVIIIFSSALISSASILIHDGSVEPKEAILRTLLFAVSSSSAIFLEIYSKTQILEGRFISAQLFNSLPLIIFWPALCIFQMDPYQLAFMSYLVVLCIAIPQMRGSKISFSFVHYSWSRGNLSAFLGRLNLTLMDYSLLATLKAHPLADSLIAAYGIALRLLGPLSIAAGAYSIKIQRDLFKAPSKLGFTSKVTAALTVFSATGLAVGASLALSPVAQTFDKSTILFFLLMCICKAILIGTGIFFSIVSFLIRTRHIVFLLLVCMLTLILAAKVDPFLAGINLFIALIFANISVAISFKKMEKLNES
jgi:hypothetical protein